MARRVERLMLGVPLVPRSIVAIRVTCHQDSKVGMDWMHRFLPMLRYGSPMLEFDFRKLQRAVPEEPKEEAAPESSTPETEDKARRTLCLKAQEPEETPEAPVDAAREHMELEFSDGTRQMLNMDLYVSSHQVMQRILDVDAEKTLSAG
ncbi:unnamed protein product [Effrenium voratum]|uniref:Uncharacterized protein n=1 Tax=Effrenium voratum TaxID=2562239 RepID=A0AA36JKK2_9DINO|nr:unnamed protein product [Effrenium voratum]